MALTPPPVCTHLLLAEPSPSVCTSEMDGPLFLLPTSSSILMGLGGARPPERFSGVSNFQSWFYQSFALSQRLIHSALKNSHNQHLQGNRNFCVYVSEEYDIPSTYIVTVNIGLSLNFVTLQVYME